MAKICRYCGNQLPDEANICLDCFSLCNESEQPKTNYKRKKAKSILAIVSSFIMLIGCYTSSAMICNNKTEIINGNEISDSESKDDGSTLKELANKMYNLFSNNDNENTEKNSSETNNADTSEDISNFSPISDNSPVSSNNNPNSDNSPVSSNNNSSTRNNSPTTSSRIDSTTQPSSDKGNVDNGTDSFDYSIEDEKLYINKYTGNAVHVVIPDKIDGLNVYKIQSGAFKSNSKIKSITFKDSEEYHTLWINVKAFEDLSSLEKITFPKNTDLGILNDVCNNCPELSQINIDNWQYKMVDGGLYYYNTKEWTIQYLCEGFNQTTFNVPTWCRNIYQSDLLTYNAYVTTVNINSYISSVSFIGGSKYIKEVNVDSENPYLKSINGIVYSKNNQNKLIYYPYAKQDKEFEIPNNTYISFSYDVNKYIETLKIPASVTMEKSTIKNICLNYTFKNLKTIYIEKASPYADQFKSTFTGKTILY